MSKDESFHINLKAYDKVEKLDTFSETDFYEYCQNKLNGCDSKVRFIQKEIMGPHWKGRIAEIGSGNSKLMYAFERAGILLQGWAYEVSRSRYCFAEKFKTLINSRHVHNINNNILDEPFLTDLNLIIGVDVVWQLITAISPDSENQLITWVYKSLKTGGHLILELNDFSDIIASIRSTHSGILKTWQRFPEYDPWEFVLETLSEDTARNLVWDKIFINRTSSERSNFTNVLKNYTKESICNLLSNNGFCCSLYSYWNKQGDMDEDGGYIVSATKK